MAYALTIFVLVHALYSLWHIASTYAPDFSVFYEAAGGLVAHTNIYTLPMYTGLGYPPFTLLPFLPFTWIPYQIAQTVWVFLSFTFFLISLVLSLRLVKKNVTTTEYAMTFVLAFLYFPTKFTLGMGQINFLALSIFLLSILNVIKIQFSMAGILLGVVFIIKPHFIFFLPLFLIIRHYRTAIIAVGILSVAILLSGQVFGWNLYTYYLNNTVPPLLEYAGRDIYYNQGIGSFFARLLPFGLARDISTQGSLLLVALSYFFIIKKRFSLLESLYVLLPVFLIIEPLSWQHHYVFLLPVYVWLSHVYQKKTWYLLWIACSFILVGMNIASPNIFASIPLSGVILSHVFLGNCMILLLAYKTVFNHS